MKKVFILEDGTRVDAALCPMAKVGDSLLVPKLMPLQAEVKDPIAESCSIKYELNQIKIIEIVEEGK